VLGEDAAEAYPFIATLLGVGLEAKLEQWVRDFAPDAVQRQTFDWLYQLLCALAGERPLCLVLEDLHWSDEATLSLLDELLPAVERAPIGFLLVHRSDPDHHGWPLVDRARRRFRRRFVEIELGPLTDDESRTLADASVGGELARNFAQLLADRAGGNPYFIGEALRDLRERGALERENERVALVGERSIPTAVHEVLQARLDRLDVEARELITTAAVIGRTFGVSLLERLFPPARVRPILSELQWLQFLVEDPGGGASAYRFRHGLVQDVAYGRLVEARRRELHRAVGEALESIHRDSPADVYGVLARHFAEAEEPQRAIDYLLKTADAARAVYAETEAIELYRRALGFLDRIGDDARARATLLKIGLTHHLAFHYEAANEAFGEAFARRAPAPPRPEPNERITWALTAAWDREVAPGHSSTAPAAQVTVNLFRGLVALGRDFEIEPDLAERFSVSIDGCSYRFTLRADCRWSDGAPVTAADFAFTFARMAADDVVGASYLEGLSATALDDRTLEIRLREPRSDLLHLLSQPMLFAWPRHVYERKGRDWHRAVPLVGNGPFVLIDQDENRVVLQAAPTWHGARGNVGELTIQLKASPAVAADRWRRGEYDVLGDFLTSHAVADDETVVQRSPAMATWYLGFNATRAPFDDTRVRRALAHAINRNSPAQLLGAVAAETGGLLPPTMPGHSHRVAPRFDPDRARVLLSAAGYADARALGEFVLVCLDLWKDAASDVTAQLARIGVRVRLHSAASDPEGIAAIVQGAADAWLWGWAADYADPGGGFLDPYVRSHPVYGDEELEQLLTRAGSLRDQDERLRTYREFERIWIGEHAAVVPLAYGERQLWRRPWVTGMWVNALARSTFAETVVRSGDT
jgi:ABC-type transport system substrate-binding protein